MNHKLLKILNCLSLVFCLGLVQAQTITLSGTITSVGGNPIENVNIQAQIDGNLYNATTDADGTYQLQIPEDAEGIVKLSLEDDPKENMTFRDLLQMRKFILYVDTDMELWQNLAANFDFSNSTNSTNGFPIDPLDGISTYDMVLMAQIFLDVGQEYASQWRFFNADMEYVDEFPIAELGPLFPGLSINFTGVKLGDLDCH